MYYNGWFLILIKIPISQIDLLVWKKVKKFSLTKRFQNYPFSILVREKFENFWYGFDQNGSGRFTDNYYERQKIRLYKLLTLRWSTLIYHINVQYTYFSLNIGLTYLLRVLLWYSVICYPNPLRVL